MKKTLRRMTLAALLLGTPAAFAEETSEDGVGGVRQVAYIGDMPSESESAYFGGETQARPVQHQARQTQTHQTQTRQTVAKVQRAQHAAPAAVPMPVVAQQPVMTANQFAPVHANQLRPIGSQVQQVGCATGNCDGPTCGAAPSSGGGCASSGCDSSSCDGGCDSMGGGGKGLGLCGGGLTGNGGWMRHEALLWFLQDRYSPSLVNTAPEGSVPPLVGVFSNPPSTTVFGGDLNGGLSAGYRFDGGVFLTEDLGIGGRFWWLSENEDSISLTGDGTGDAIARPFFDIGLATPSNNALLVNVAGLLRGDVSASSRLEMMAGEIYTRTNLSSTNTCQLDLIGGLSHFDVEDTLDISSSTIALTTGQTLRLNDRFATENTMTGGQFGFEAVVTSGRFFARSLTKVHMGEMEQTVRISGSGSNQIPPLAPTLFGDGMLAQGNQGTYQRDHFTFIPEMNFKLGYRFRDHVEMTVGYTFLMFDSLALAGEQIDFDNSGVDIINAGFVANRPAFTGIKDTSLWVQGIDIGLAISY